MRKRNKHAQAQINDNKRKAVHMWTKVVRRSPGMLEVFVADFSTSPERQSRNIKAVIVD
jgi:hypothetical protein